MTPWLANPVDFLQFNPLRILWRLRHHPPPLFLVNTWHWIPLVCPSQFLFLLFVLFQSLNVIIGSSVLDPLFLVISATFGFWTVWLLLFGALNSCVSLVAVAAVVPSPVDDFCSGPCFHAFVGFIGVSLWTSSMFLKNMVRRGQGTPPAWAFTSLLSGRVAHLHS